MITIIIPAYNEEKRRIDLTLQDYCTYFSRFPRGEIEILVVVNGSTDNTLGIVKRFAKHYSFLRLQLKMRPQAPWVIQRHLREVMQII